jgi:hypothetical protein
MENLPPLPPQPDSLPPIITHISEMKDADIEKIMCPRFRESYERCKKEGLYCCKRNLSKEIKESKEREEKEKEEQQKILQERNLILEQQARLQEQAFLDYKAQTEERFNKLAELIKSLK